jgi:hypothetical protein
MSDLAHNFLANLMLESGEVKDAVERLADCFLTYEAGGISSLACRTNNVKQTEQMQIWSKQVINLYKENRSFSDRLALTTFSKKLRWNLLVAASYVCCGQLPTATVSFSRLSLYLDSNPLAYALVHASSVLSKAITTVFSSLLRTSLNL